MSFDEPFTLPDGRVGHWKHAHPFDKQRIDDAGHIVKPRETRAWVNDPMGTATKDGHNKRKYYCVVCVDNMGGPSPPKRYF